MCTHAQNTAKSFIFIVCFQSVIIIVCWYFLLNQRLQYSTPLYVFIVLIINVSFLLSVYLLPCIHSLLLAVSLPIMEAGAYMVLVMSRAWYSLPDKHVGDLIQQAR